MRNAFHFTVIWLTVLGLSLASCAPAAAPAPTATPAAAPAPKAAPPVATPKPAADQPTRAGGSLALPAAGDPPNLDIHRGTGTALFGPIGPVYSGIVQYDQGNNVVPDLAERWEVSPDGKTYTFYLHRGVKWHDGKPFTSADAKFSLERIRQYPDLSTLAGAIAGIDTPDENALKVTLEHRQAGFLPLLGHGRVLIAPKHVIDAEKDLKRVAMGTGPFKLKEYMVGVGLRMEKNSDYFIKGRPYLDEVRFYIIKDVSSRFAAFRTQRVPIYGHPPTNGELMQRHADILRTEAPQVQVRLYGAMQAYGFMPNWNRPPWNDVRVRQAAFLAIDREKGLETVSEGLGSLGISVFYGEWALPKEELMKIPGFRKPKDQDIAEAKRLLAEAGYPQGLKSTLVGRADVPLHTKSATFVNDQLSKIGIDLTLRIVDYAIWVETRNRQDYELFFSSLNVDPIHPDALGRYISKKMGATWASEDDEKILELFNAQSQAETDTERKKAVFDLQRRIAEVVPHVMIGWQGSFIALWPQVRNYTADSGIFSHLKLEEIWLSR